MSPLSSTAPRSAGLAGILAGLAFAAATFLPTLPGGDGGVAKALAAYRDSGTRVNAVLASALLVAAALLLAWFLATVLLRSAAAGALSVFAALTGIATVVAMLTAAAALLATATPLMMNAGAVPDAATTATGLLAVSALVVAGLAGGATVVALSVAARRTATLPTWVTRVGFVVGPLLVLSVAVTPVVLLAVWLVLAGAALALRGEATQPVPAPAAVSVGAAVAR